MSFKNIAAILLLLKFTNCEDKNFHCGRSEYIAPFILKGTDSQPGQWPWTVSFFNDSTYLCGATLINQEFVLIGLFNIQICFSLKC